MNTGLTLKRAVRAATVLVISAAMPEALKAACINGTTNGLQTITCCGETFCCTSFWRGSELLHLVCE